MSLSLNRCPGCGSAVLAPPYRIVSQPVVLNYRLATATAARRLRRKDIVLVQCGGCGLIFNRNFRDGDVPYDGQYDNRQGCSPAFGAYSRNLARRLAQRLKLRHQRVLEIGCGKGDFLRMLCQMAPCEGAGYDMTYEGEPEPKGSPLRFYRRYLRTGDISEPFAAVLCRHVIEHVPAVGPFLDDLRAIGLACGQPVMVLETPAFEWIAARGAFWDICYEHCNYFTQASLAALCCQHGLKVLRHRRTFGGQYQVIELAATGVPDASRKTVPRPPDPAVLSRFAREAESELDRIKARLQKLGAKKGWAIWGAGAKGVSLANRLPDLPPTLLLDSNPAKQGGFVPGLRVPIVAPEDPRLLSVALIVIVNHNYAREIRAVLRRRKFRGQTVVL